VVVFFFFLISTSLFSCQKRYVDSLYTGGLQPDLRTAPRAYKCLFTSPITRYPSWSSCSDSVVLCCFKISAPLGAQLELSHTNVIQSSSMHLPAGTFLQRSFFQVSQFPCSLSRFSRRRLPPRGQVEDVLFTHAPTG
jgi:hypothetical protein